MKYAIYALLLSAAVTMVSGPVLIPLLHKLKFGQSERKLGPETHLKKAGTPGNPIRFQGRRHRKTDCFRSPTPICNDKICRHWVQISVYNLDGGVE